MIGQMTVLPVNSGYAPDMAIGSRVANITLDFSQVTSPQAGDFQNILSAGQMGMVQSAFVDNADNPQSLTIQIDGAGMRLVIPPFSQGTFPLICKQGNSNFSVATSGAVAIEIFLQNIPQPFAVWGIGALPSGGATSANQVTEIAMLTAIALNVGSRTVTDASGTIAVGGTSQNIVAAEPAGHIVEIQNPFNALESLFVNNAGAAETVPTVSIELIPGGSWKSDLITNAVSVNAVTGAHVFVAKITR